MHKNEKYSKIIPEHLVLIEGILSARIKKKTLAVKQLIISEAAMAELEHQANESLSTGYLGLDEIKKLQDLKEKFNFVLEFMGTRPRPTDIKFAKKGEIDNLIRQLAFDEDAALITADYIQAKVANAKGINTVTVKPSTKIKKLKLEKFFENCLF